MEHSMTPQNIASATATGTHENIRKRPIFGLTPGNYDAGTGSKDFIESLVSDGGVDIRVDWNGDPASQGRFDVRVGQNAWQPCPNIEVSSMNDLISPREQPEASALELRVARGPEHVSIPFQVKLIPIVWMKEHEPGAIVPPTYTAERGIDYSYREGQEPDSYPWQTSAGQNGVQRAAASLIKGTAYEMHVRLRHPSDPDCWRQQDPIIRSDHGGSN